MICGAGPTKTSILNTLKKFMVAAEFVSEDEDQYENLFGNLHVVLRDCSNDEDECSSIIFDLEDESPPQKLKKAERNALVERNDIRRSIASSFKTTKVWTLPKLDIKATEKGNERHREIAHQNNEYMSKIGQMRKVMIKNLAEPKYISGQKLTGPLLNGLLSHIKDSLNSDAPQLNPPSIMETVCKNQFKETEDKVINKIAEQLLECEKLLPLLEEEFEANEILSEIENESHREMEECLEQMQFGDIDLESFSLRYQDLKAKLEQRNQTMLSEKRKEETKQIQTVKEQLLKSFIEQISTVTPDGPPLEEKQLVDCLNQVEIIAYKDWDLSCDQWKYIDVIGVTKDFKEALQQFKAQRILSESERRRVYIEKVHLEEKNEKISEDLDKVKDDKALIEEKNRNLEKSNEQNKQEIEGQKKKHVEEMEKMKSSLEEQLKKQMDEQKVKQQQLQQQLQQDNMMNRNSMFMSNGVGGCSKQAFNCGSKSSGSNGREICTGPRGGQYYINGNGNKTYLKR
eukprot:Awhi_evm1s12823